MSETKEKNKSQAVDPQTERALGEADEKAGTTEMVLTYNTETGELIHIYNVDQSGARQELTNEEYAQFFGQGSGDADASGQNAYESAEAYAIAYQQLGFEQGYYCGIAEYEATLAAQTQSAYSPEEEAAYYQGVADYQALVSGQA